MTSEQRLNRLERIAKLFVAAGLRARRNMRDLDEKINILVDAQIRNDERFAKSDERFARFEERCAKFDERFAKSDERFARFEERCTEFDERFAKSDERFARVEAQTDQTLKALMGIVAELRNGHS